MKRLLTAAVGVPLALLATFRLPLDGFFLLVLLAALAAVVEYVRIGRHFAAGAPLVSLFALVPLASLGLWVVATRPELLAAWMAPAPLVASFLLLLGVGVGTLVLFARTPVEQVVPAFGVISFGLPYFVAPIVTIALLQGIDPWLLFLLYAIVWLGDTAAFYVGSAWGRHKLAPVVSPKKSWEGAAASLVTSVVAAAIWSVWRLDHLDVPLLLVAAVTSVAAQVGDLVESLFKRGAGVKDSGTLIPGHGGMLDRLDAMLFAGPVFYLALCCAGLADRVR